MSDRETWYRYDDSCYEDEDLRLVLSEHRVTSATPSGVWLDGDRFVVTHRKGRPVTKQFAWPSAELALESYRSRKRAQIGHLRAALRRAEMALLLTPDRPIASDLRLLRVWP